MKQSKVKAQVLSFLSYAREHGFAVSIRGEVIEVSQSFTPNDPHGFANFEMIGSGLLFDIPATRSRNIWGSTGDGVGGMVAMQKGFGSLNLSGAQKSFLKELNVQLA